MRRRARALAVLAISATLSSAFGQSTGTAMIAAPVAAIVAKDYRIEPSRVPGATFRFLPDGPSRSFDRPLVFEAAPGEERSYSIEIQEGDSTFRKDILIDRRVPSAPRAALPSGAYDRSLTVGLETEVGATLRFHLAGPSSESSGFLKYDPRNPPRLAVPSTGSATWTLLAFAIDAAGNQGPVSRFVYRLAAPGLPIEAPKPEAALPSPRRDARLELPDPRISVEKGRTRLVLPSPPKGRIMAAVSPGENLDRPEAWTELVVDGKDRVLVLECPYGWSGELDVFLGIDSGQGIGFRPDPLRVHLADTADLSLPVSIPLPPLRLDSTPGFASFLAFPPYEGEILFRIDGGNEAIFADPIPFGAGGSALHVEWRGRNRSGSLSESQSINFARPIPLPPVRLLGADASERSSGPIRISSAGSGIVRYELTDDGSIPPEPGKASRLLEGELVLEAPAGKTLTYTLRYRPFTDAGSEAQGGDSAMVSYIIDREPPEPPRVVAAPAAYSRGPLKLELAATEGRIFASVSSDGSEGTWREIKGPIDLPGSTDSPRSWTIRAYAVDSTGNRSTELGPLRYVVDTSCVYADSKAPSAGDGSPGKPFASIAEAIAMAKASDRQIIRIRGEFLPGLPLVLGGTPLTLEGGFAPDWTSSNLVPASIALTAPRQGSPSLSIRDSSVRIRGIDLRAGRGDGILIELQKSSLALDSLSLFASSARNLIAISMKDSTLNIANSSLSLDGTGGGALVSADDSQIRVSASDLSSAASIDYFTGISLRGGSIEFNGSRISSTAGIGLVAFLVEKGRATIDRSTLSIGGATGYVRGGSFTLAEVALRNSHVEFDRVGGATLFESIDTNLSLVHDTLFAQADPAELVFFDRRGGGISLVNDLFLAPSGEALLLRSDSVLSTGSILACAFLGFSAYAGGAEDLRDIRALDRLDPRPPSGRNILLPPAGILERSPKNGITLFKGSPAVDAGIPLADPAYSKDFSGQPRPDTNGRRLPDIGADELQ
jgi:hypothetical protein